MSAAGSTLGSALPLDASAAAETHPIVVPPAITLSAGQHAPNGGAHFIHLLLYLCDAFRLEV
jgi:hypothetical protein